MRQVAILDDDPSMRCALARLLKMEGMVVSTYAESGQLFEALAREYPDCLILDLQMPKMSGVDVLKHLNRIGVRLPVIILTASDNAGSGEACLKMGAAVYLRKPVDADRLIQAIEGIAKARPVPLRAVF
jgi:FixJ family two-component response regulator